MKQVETNINNRIARSGECSPKADCL